MVNFSISCMCHVDIISNGEICHSRLQCKVHVKCFCCFYVHMNVELFHVGEGNRYVIFYICVDKTGEAFRAIIKARGYVSKANEPVSKQSDQASVDIVG